MRGEKEVLSEYRNLCSTALALLDVSDAVFKVRLWIDLIGRLCVWDVCVWFGCG